MLEVVAAIAVCVIIMVGVVALSIWVMKACDPCRHAYERIDTYNDKKIILVCRRCGKIKKLKK